MPDPNAASRDLEKEDGTLAKPRTDAQILEEARERLKRCIDDYDSERTKQKDDLLFCTLEQWPSDIRNARENDPNGARPCLTIDQINQYIVQVENDIRQNRHAVKVRPVDDKADVETAEVLQGMVRQIEDQSTAQIPYITAAGSAVRIGEGYFRFVTEYEDENSFNQAIKVKRVQDSFSVVLGPHVMPTGEDAPYGFIFEDIPTETFRRQFPGAKYQAADFSELADFKKYWGDDKHVRVCEYFYFDEAEEELVFVAGGKTMKRKAYEELEEKPAIEQTRKVRAKKLKWCKLTGIQILEKRELPGKYIPIVKVTGKEAWVDGKRVVWGLVRPAKDSLRMYNYWASTITEKLALAPKTPFIIEEGQIEGHETEWQNANKVNYAVIKYKGKSVDGTIVPPPQRQPPAPLEVAMIQQLQIIREDVKASLGMYKASIGQEQPNQSGKAILALVRESDTGTFHFQDNMALSIAYGGRIMLDMIPHYYDVQRVVKILGEDGKMKTAELDPQQQVARQQMQDEVTGKVRTIYNPNIGIYDVTVTVGPSYNTKRMEAATLFTDLANSSKDPISAAVVRYLAIKNSDFNGAQQAAEMLEKLLPPGIVPQDGQPPIPPGVAQQMMQMKQAGDAMAQELEEAKSGIKEAQMKIEAQEREAQAKLKISSAEQAQKLQLEQEKAEAQLQLEREKAAAQIELEKAKAQAQIEIERMKIECSADAEIDTAIQKIKAIGMVHETKVKAAIAQDEASVEAGEKGEKKAGKEAEALGKEFTTALQTIVDGLKSKKKIKIIRENGQLVGAEVS